MTEVELIKKYENEKEVYKKWGKFVTNYVAEQLVIQNLYDKIIKIEPKPRLKDNKSLISKGFYRDKKYKNPYEEITDKVGTRFVVLLTTEISHISKIVEKCESWIQSKDRDFEEEKLKAPEFFTYQSVHYIVRNKNSFDFENSTIPIDIPCEIQIRTLLQHAYSELTHDTIYKPTVRTTPKIKRLIARSMALIETTDNIFLNVMEELNNIENKRKELLNKLSEFYKSFNNLEFEPKMNNIILDSFDKILENVNINEVFKFFDNNQTLKNIIKRKSKTELLYSQPIILLLYYFLTKYTNETKNKWPLSFSHLTPIFIDLGIANPL